MKEAFEKIIKGIEGLKANLGFEGTIQQMYADARLDKAIEIVNQVAEEYNDRTFINGKCCWQSCACTEKCQECNRYTLSDSDIDWYESIEDWNEEFGSDINVRSNDGVKDDE